jgi:hypothetical protein
MKTLMELSQHPKFYWEDAVENGAKVSPISVVEEAYSDLKNVRNSPKESHENCKSI